MRHLRRTAVAGASIGGGAGPAPGPGAVGGRAQRWLFATAATAGVLCLLLTAATLLLGLTPLIFTSGSMAPGIPSGSLGLAVQTPRDAIVPGEVVSVLAADGTRVTHRVVGVDPQQGLFLRGDANAVADLEPYRPDTVGRVLGTVPVVGAVLAWFMHPAAAVAGALLCLWLLYLAFVRRDTPAPAGATHGRRRAGAALLALTVLGAGGLALPPLPAQAAFTGQALAQAAVTAVTPSRATGAACANVAGDKNTIRVSWAAPAVTPTGYLIGVVQTTAAGVPLVPAVSNSVSIPGGSTSYETTNTASSGLLGAVLDLLLGYNNYYTLSITPQYGGWSAPAVNFAGVNASAPLLIILGEYKLSCPALPTS